MADIDYCNAIEAINKEYLQQHGMHAPLSAEQITGLRIKHVKEAFPFHIFDLIMQSIRRRNLEKKNSLISDMVKDEDVWYATGEPEDRYHGIVYCCVTGNYDRPYNPILISNGLDYFAFTDNPDAVKGTHWQYKPIQMQENDSRGNGINRYYKFHPYELFSGEYDYSIYIDGNVQIISDITCLYEVARKAPFGIAMHRHASRRCAYKDIKWCLLNHKGNPDGLEKQRENFLAEGFPEDYGLYEATIIVVDLHNEKGKKLLNEWWNEFLKSNSGRDQPALPYVIWKNGYKMDMIGSLGNNEYRNPKFRIFGHALHEGRGIP